MENILNSLNSEQKQAVNHQAGPLLIVAGAGTGKTMVITARIANLILNQEIKPEEILALTFTDKAAGEMEDRVEKILPYGYVDLWISTFHAFAERILKNHALEIGLPNDFKLLNTTEQWLLVRQNLDKFNLDYYHPLGNPTKFIHALIRHFSRAKDETITPQDYLNYIEELKMNSDSAEFIRTIIDDGMKAKLKPKELKDLLSYEIKKQEEIADAYHIYQQLLIDNNFLDFGDLINYCLELFKNRPNILAQYRRQFQYLLVDEFQDTNYAQYELIKLLAAPQNNLTVVGDDDQSIYKFRGASLSNIMQFKQDYPAAKQIILTHNYRSQQKILDLAYGFIQKNNPYRLEAALSGNSGNQFNKKLIGQSDKTGDIVHLHGQKLLDEVKLVVDKILELYNAEPDTNWSDFAILVRANNSANEFVYVLETAGIPYDFVASKGLYTKDIILNLMAYLRLLDDYHENTATYRVINFPLWNLNQKDIISLSYWAKRKGWSLYETMRQASSLNNISQVGQETISRIIKLIEQHTGLVQDNHHTSEIIQNFLQDSGYLKLLTETDNLINRQNLNYLNQFYQKIQEFEKDSQNRFLADWLKLMELELESGEEGSLKKNLEQEGPDSVKIMTIHAAKGLEFKYVFIVSLVDKKFPSIGKSEPIELPEKLIKETTPEGDVHLQEERRLMYVAITRAKDGLYLTSASDYGGARKKKLSRFLLELEEQGLKLSIPIDKAEKTLFQSTKPKPRSDSKPEFVLPKKFSFSQLKAFETCPYQYYFSYILKIPLKGKPQFSFGKSIHSALQKFFLLLNQQNQQGNLFDSSDKTHNIKEPGLENLLQLYQGSFIDDWYENKKQKQEYYDLGKKALTEFYHQHQGNWPQSSRVEYPFNLKLANPQNNEVYTLYGLIDRIDEIAGGIRIVDYKTGNSKAKLSAEDKEQLLIYQIAAQEVLKEEVKELVFYYINDNSQISFLGTDKDLAKIKQKTIKLIEQIKTMDFPPQPGHHCQYCDFRHICDFHQI